MENHRKDLEIVHEKRVLHAYSTRFQVTMSSKAVVETLTGLQSVAKGAKEVSGVVTRGKSSRGITTTTRTRRKSADDCGAFAGDFLWEDARDVLESVSRKVSEKKPKEKSRKNYCGRLCVFEIGEGPEIR